MSIPAAIPGQHSSSAPIVMRKGAETSVCFASGDASSQGSSTAGEERLACLASLGVTRRFEPSLLALSSIQIADSSHVYLYYVLIGATTTTTVRCPKNQMFRIQVSTIRYTYGLYICLAQHRHIVVPCYRFTCPTAYYYDCNLL